MSDSNASLGDVSLSGDSVDGLEYIDDGRHREAYRIVSDRFGSGNQGRVVKFARSDVGREANECEFETWMAVRSTRLRQHFCPIRDRSPDYNFIVMDYAETLEKFSDEVNEFIHNFSSDVTVDWVRLDEQAGTDINHRNLGHHKDLGVVFIDYPFGGLVLDREDLLR